MDGVWLHYLNNYFCDACVPFLVVDLLGFILDDLKLRAWMSGVSSALSSCGTSPSCSVVSRVFRDLVSRVEPPLLKLEEKLVTTVLESLALPDGSPGGWKWNLPKSSSSSSPKSFPEWLASPVPVTCLLVEMLLDPLTCLLVVDGESRVKNGSRLSGMWNTPVPLAWYVLPSPPTFPAPCKWEQSEPSEETIFSTTSSLGPSGPVTTFLVIVLVHLRTVEEVLSPRLWVSLSWNGVTNLLMCEGPSPLDSAMG